MRRYDYNLYDNLFIQKTYKKDKNYEEKIKSSKNTQINQEKNNLQLKYEQLLKDNESTINEKEEIKSQLSDILSKNTQEKNNLQLKYEQLFKKQINEKNKYEEKLKELLSENNQIKKKKIIYN